MDVRAAHRRASDGFGQRLRAVRGESWHAPTPCSDWDVRDLVGHVVSEHRWTPPLLAGATVAEVGDRFDDDLLGDDPVAAYEAAAAEATAAAADIDLDRVVHLSFGDAPAREYLSQLFTDLLVHGWDLARATGGDERLPDDLVAACAAWFRDNEGAYRAGGAIGPRVDVPADASAQARLLAAFGRRG